MVAAVPYGYDNPYTRRLTVKDLDELPEVEGQRYELIDGELYVSPFPFVPHQRLVTRLVGMLYAYLEEHPIGEVFTSNLKVVLDEESGVGPDVVYIANERLSSLQPDGLYGPPDLAIEVTSTKPNLDRIIKFRKYASSGVAHYWIVSPEARTIEAFELGKKRYGKPTIARERGVFEPKLFPGLAIDLSRLFG